MLTPKRIRILGLFARNAFKAYTFKELKECSGEKSNSVLQKAIKAFLDENLITEQKIGTSKLYMLNHRNWELYPYLELFSNNTLDKAARKSISTLKEEIDRYAFFYSLVVFGSYAGKTYREGSDIDVAVITPDKTQKKNIDVAINSAELKSLKKLDVHIISSDEVLEMLKADYENLGKEIARKNLPLHNSAIFYKIIQRGIQNGFKIVS